MLLKVVRISRAERHRDLAIALRLVEQGLPEPLQPAAFAGVDQAEVESPVRGIPLRGDRPGLRIDLPSARHEMERRDDPALPVVAAYPDCTLPRPPPALGPAPPVVFTPPAGP